MKTKILLLFLLITGLHASTQNLQQVLNNGNVTSKRIILDTTLTLPQTGGYEDIYKQRTVLRFEPLAKNEGNAPFSFVQGTHRFRPGFLPDESMQWGWNIGDGADGSKPSISQMMEQRYINDHDLTEFHTIYRKPGQIEEGRRISRSEEHTS